MNPLCLFQDECGIPFIQAICASYDFIVIGDINFDAKPFLIPHCLKEKAQIILQTTNRFDIFSDNEWIPFLNNSLNLYPKKIRFVVNNPFEIFWMCRRNIQPSNYVMIRPTGYTPEMFDFDMSQLEKVNKNSVGVVLKANQYKNFLIPALQNMNIKFETLDGFYGGPRTLAKFKTIITLPYQVSVMSLNEGLRQGVSFMIPSQQFFLQMCRQNSDAYEMWQNVELCFEPKSDSLAVSLLTKWTEWWQPDLKELVTYFDSWVDLREKLETTNFEDVGKRAKQYMDIEETRITNAWAQVFGIRKIPSGKKFWKTLECQNEISEVS
ncbi:hypothetical protein HK096_008294 [Nowakowskiella sp. JEL0078]|nr:hypothetical protein HK096_008294 [Nowakowskiella sp. JEL0078]